MGGVAVADDPVSRRRRLAWGTLISVGLGAVSMAVEGADANIKVAALITLVGLVLTLAVELRFRTEETASAESARHDAVREALVALEGSQRAFDRHLDRFTEYVSSPDSCREFFAAVSPDWRRIDAKSSVFLGWLRQDAERQFRERLHELAAGHGAVDQRGRHHFRAHPLLDFSRIRSVDVQRSDYWNTARGRQYLASQKSAIAANGLEVSRVFVVDRAEVDDVVDVIARHAQAGVAVSIVFRDEIAADPEVPEIEDMSLVTDRSGVTGVLLPGAPGDPEVFTTEEGHVSHAEDVMDFLTPFERDVDDVYSPAPD